MPAKWHRMAVSISRKNSKKSVWRNACRRSIYDLFSHSLTPRKNAYHCVFSLKKTVILETKEIPESWRKDAENLFEKIAENKKSS